MNKRRTFLLTVVVLTLVGYLGYNYLYKDHRDIKSETSQLEITAPYLLERFSINGGETLLNRTITVTGIVTELEKGAITIDGSVYCTLSDTNHEISINESVAIKGRCIGYDDLFDVVKMDQCILIK